jgi:hypothetical protein
LRVSTKDPKKLRVEKLHWTAGTLNFTLAEPKADWEVAWYPAKTLFVAFAAAAVDTGTKAAANIATSDTAMTPMRLLAFRRLSTVPARMSGLPLSLFGIRFSVAVQCQ